jgi:hypothetical protein
LVGKCEGKRALRRLRLYEATVLKFVGEIQGGKGMIGLIWRWSGADGGLL